MTYPLQRTNPAQLCYYFVFGVVVFDDFFFWNIRLTWPRGFFDLAGEVGGAALFCATVEEVVVSTVLKGVSGSADEGLGVYDTECGGGAGAGGIGEDGVAETECRRGVDVGGITDVVVSRRLSNWECSPPSDSSSLQSPSEVSVRSTCNGRARPADDGMFVFGSFNLSTASVDSLRWRTSSSERKEC